MSSSAPAMKRRRKEVTYTHVADQVSSVNLGLSPVSIKYNMYQFESVNDQDLPSGFQQSPHKDAEANRPMFYVTENERRDDLILLSLPALNKLLRANSRDPNRFPERLKSSFSPNRTPVSLQGAMQLFSIVRSAGVLLQSPPQRYLDYDTYQVSLQQQGIADYIPNLWGDVEPGDILGWRSAMIKTEGVRHPVVLPHVINSRYELDYAPDRVESEMYLSNPDRYLQRSVDWFDEKGHISHGDFVIFAKVIRRYSESPSAQQISQALFSNPAMNVLEHTSRLDVAVMAHQTIQTMIGSSLPLISDLNLSFEDK